MKTRDAIAAAERARVSGEAVPMEDVVLDLARAIADDLDTLARSTHVFAGLETHGKQLRERDYAPRPAPRPAALQRALSALRATVQR